MGSCCFLREGRYNGVFLVDFRLLELKSNRIVRMASSPRSVAEATAARDKLMTTLAAQDGILEG